MKPAELLSALLRGIPNPEEAYAQLLPALRWIQLDAVAAPSIDQLKALQAFEPYNNQNLMQIRQALREGSARIGVFSEAAAREIAKVAFDSCGMTWKLVEPTLEELKKEGLA